MTPIRWSLVGLCIVFSTSFVPACGGDDAASDLFAATDPAEEDVQGANAVPSASTPEAAAGNNGRVPGSSDNSPLGASASGSAAPSTAPSVTSEDDAGAMVPNSADAGTGHTEPSYPDGGSLQTAAKLLIDDFSSCDAGLMSRLQSSWNPYDDKHKPNNGTSTSAAILLRSGFGTSPCALRWLGTVTTAYEFGFAGIALDLPNVKAGEFRQLVFRVRGDGRQHRISFPLRQQLAEQEYNYFGSTFACGDKSSAWVQVAVNLSALKQEEGWGQKRNLDLNSIAKLQIQTVERPILSFQCDIGRVELSD